MTTLQQHIIKALAYFDIFNYPLKNDEIRYFLAQPAMQEAVDAEIAVLLAQGRVFKIGAFYSLQDNIMLAERRQNGNNRAAKEMINAAKAARILARFPYVEALAISGSLSKNFADEKSDIDFFIIAKNGRIWIARSLMHVFAKLAKLAGRRRWFCMNYYIDAATLEIEEQNIFTAIEVATLLPMHGKPALQEFMQANAWVKDYFPSSHTDIEMVPPVKKGAIRSAIEKLFDNKMGNALDNWLMKITAKRWKKKAARRSKNHRGIVLGMLTGKHYSKPDPINFQRGVIEKYENKVNELLQSRVGPVRQPVLAQ